jgi:hypothetical protein
MSLEYELCSRPRKTEQSFASVYIVYFYVLIVLCSDGHVKCNYSYTIEMFTIGHLHVLFVGDGVYVGLDVSFNDT